jgi:hypothetical protein
MFSAVQFGVPLADRVAPSPGRRPSPSRVGSAAAGGLTPGSYALAVSTIEARKNHVLLFRVWRHLLESRPAASVPKLVFAGRVGWLVADLMQQIANTRNLDGHLVLVTRAFGRGTRGALPRLPLHPVPLRFTKGWGLPITESLGFGKPCLAAQPHLHAGAGGPLARYADPEHVGAWDGRGRPLLDDRRTSRLGGARPPRVRPGAVVGDRRRVARRPRSGPPGVSPSASTAPAAP